MLQLRAAVCLSFVLSFLLSGMVLAATPEEIQASLTRAKAWVYSQQTPDGHWELAAADVPKETNKPATGGQWGGRTAIATYALLAAGESPQDPRLSKAIQWLSRTQFSGVYAVGLRSQVWTFLPSTPEVLQLARRDAQLLMNSVNLKGRALGHYGYYPDATTNYSHSRSQYGVLGVWAAAQLGVEVNARYWQAIEAGWIQNQDPSGGWSYQHPSDTKHATTPGMTAAGVASLFIVQDYLYAAKGLDCRSDRGARSDAAIGQGMKWLIANFDKVASNTKYERDFPLATIYAIERVGVASGRKYFGSHDWYAKGSAWLLANQDKDGSYKRYATYTAKLPGTAFAMLFLARGGAPIVMNKLEYGDGKSSAWNNRPRDVANVSRWIGRQFERDLNWQAVNFTAAAADLHDAPILYISGNEAVQLSDEQKATLKSYVEQGGLIVGHSDCNARPFADSFRRLSSDLFPDQEFRILPDDHLVYTNRYQRANWRSKPRLMGIGNGVRELMLLVSNGDPARDWQTMETGGKEPSWQLAANLYLYAVENQIPAMRGQTHIVLPDSKITPTARVTVARLQHDGNWDPEPGGWKRLAAVLHNRRKVGLETRAIKPGEAIEGVKLAHLTGTAGLTLSNETKAQIKRFIDGGGTLLIDAAGGNSAFADAAEAMLRELYPDQALEVVPPDSPLLRASGEKFPDRLFREYARATLGNVREPRLKAITLNARPAILYSREDLSAGLVGQAIDGVLGYTPDAATAIVSNILHHTHNLK